MTQPYVPVVISWSDIDPTGIVDADDRETWSKVIATIAAAHHAVVAVDAGADDRLHFDYESTLASSDRTVGYGFIRIDVAESHPYGPYDAVDEILENAMQVVA